MRTGWPANSEFPKRFNPDTEPADLIEDPVWRAKITSARIDAYIAARLDEGHKRGTINVEVSLLRRAFNIARKAERVASLPIFELHDPKDARKGFFEREQFEAVLRGPTGRSKASRACRLPDRLASQVGSPDATQAASRSERRLAAASHICSLIYFRHVYAVRGDVVLMIKHVDRRMV
jgi:hypothetical protein